MYDAGKILGGIVIFLILVTSPLWFNAMTSEAPTMVELAKPPNGSQQCVEETAYMRASHMDLLNEWRDEVVREGKRVHTSELTGASFDASLSRTCMSCHSNKAEFCDRCHDYMVVDPYCWDCHVAPVEVQ